MSSYRYIAFTVATANVVAIAYVGLYQSRLVGLICPFGAAAVSGADASKNGTAQQLSLGQTALRNKR